jgi:hypothetical protein
MSVAPFPWSWPFPPNACASLAWRLSSPFQPARLILTVGEPLFIGNPFGGWWYAFNGAGKMGWVHNLYVSPLWDELPPLYAHYCAPILL